MSAIGAYEEMTDNPFARRALVATRARDGEGRRLHLEHGALQRRGGGHHQKGLLQLLVEIGQRATDPDNRYGFAFGSAAALLDELGNKRQLMHGLGDAG